MRQRVIPRLPIRLGEVDLGPWAGFHKGLGRVAAELAAADHVRPEEVDKRCLAVI